MVTKGLKESRLEGNHPTLSRLSDPYLNVHLYIFHDSPDEDTFASTMNRTWPQECQELYAGNITERIYHKRIEKLLCTFTEKI